VNHSLMKTFKSTGRAVKVRVNDMCSISLPKIFNLGNCNISSEKDTSNLSDLTWSNNDTTE
jgi:hypothetical protein